ncbi:MAG: T9SS type A sorting domain-containing protein [Ignavibacteria bacterium]|nr:T9SS type A sorting domain-containing protein [Ignavibacteria bacterium]
MKIKFKLFQTITFILVLCSTLFAQWSSNPAANLAICDTTGEQALAKIESTSDGGCYISWFDNRSGSYAVYLQRLDPLGNKLWAPTGLLISNNPQSTSLVDYDLLVDADDHAVIAFTDTRNGGNLNVFAYRISSNGDFVWGNNGISLSGSTDFQANPKLAQTDDGNIVVTWIIAATRNQVGLQKISTSGVKLWGTNPIILQSATEGYSYPDIVPSDSGGVILFHTAVTGTFPAQTVKIRAKKISSSGTVSWNTNIQDLGTIAAFTVPKVYSDKNNGGLIAWHDDRDNNSLQSGFVQRVSSTGSIYFPVNGAEVSLMTNRHKFNPVVAFDNVSNETYVFWMETEPNQNQNGISGQKLSLNGTRQWTDNAKIFKGLSAPNTVSISSLNSQMGNGRAYLFYLEGSASGLNDKVEGFACDANGSFLWTGNFTILSNTTSDKLQMVSTVDIYKNCKLAWGDNRSDASGIYAQDINPDGQLGNSVVPVELTSFTANVVSGSVRLNWITATELNNSGFEIERSCHTERSRSMTGWEKIEFVYGNGTTSESHSYSFTDNLTLTHNLSLRYRLKQIDFDGSFTYSNEVEVDFSLSTSFTLEQNYPNPFNPSTTIRYTISNVISTEGRNLNVTLKVYDVLGSEVAMLVNEKQPAGNYEVIFDAKNQSSGIYYCKLQAGSFNQSIKMILMK